MLLQSLHEDGLQNKDYRDRTLTYCKRRVDVGKFCHTHTHHNQQVYYQIDFVTYVLGFVFLSFSFVNFMLMIYPCTGWLMQLIDSNHALYKTYACLGLSLLLYHKLYRVHEVQCTELTYYDFINRPYCHDSYDFKIIKL